MLELTYCIFTWKIIQIKPRKKVQTIEGETEGPKDAEIPRVSISTAAEALTKPTPESKPK